MNRQLKSILLQKKGLTLIEVLVVISLIGMLSLPLIQFLLSGQKQFVSHQDTLSEKSVFILLQEKIKDEVLLAKSIRIVDENTPFSLEEGEAALYLKEESGQYELVKKTAGAEQVLLNKDYLKISSMAISFNLKAYGQKALEVMIDGENYQIDTAFQLPNFKQGVENAEETQGEILIYKK